MPDPGPDAQPGSEEAEMESHESSDLLFWAHPRPGWVGTLCAFERVPDMALRDTSLDDLSSILKTVIPGSRSTHTRQPHPSGAGDHTE